MVLIKSTNPDVKYFESIPWCAAHLAEPNTVRETASSRFPKPNGEDQLFSYTLNTPETIPFFLTVYNLPSPEDIASQEKKGFGSKNPLIGEVKHLISLANGVAGYPGVCHGGVVASILDEIIGLLIPVNMAHGAMPEGSFMTGYLNTTFLKPVAVPGDYLCRAKIGRVEGRKCFIEGTIEDGEGNVLARGDSVFISTKSRM